MKLVDGDRMFFGLVSLNVLLEGTYHAVIRAGPFFNSLLPLLQSVVAAVTVWHVVQKWLGKRKKSHEKNSTPPDSSGADI